MKKENTGRSFKRGETHISSSNEIRKVKIFSRKIWYVLALIVGVFLFVLFIPGSGKVSAKEEALIVIEKAKILAQYVPDTKEKAIVLHILEEMKIGYAGSDGRVVIPPYTIGYLVIAKNDEMTEMGDTNTDKYSIYMSFNFEDLRDHNAVVIFMNQDYARKSSDVDLKATSLLHELYHALQAMGHLANKDFSPPNSEELIQEEKKAWEAQAFIYSKVHPDLFQGTSVDCQTGLVRLSSDKYKSNVEKDPLLLTLLQIVFCPEMIREIYKK